MVDALHAVGALLHHAAAADRDVRVPERVVALRIPVRIEQEVEAPDLVRAVVRAVPRADAAVVDHVVQAFRAVGRRGDRADDLARRVLALLTGHRLVDRLHRLRRVDVAGEVVVDADPVHLAVLAHLLLADHRDVVFRHAGDDAGAAAGARRQVDGHAPLVALVLVVRVQRQRLGERVRHVRDDSGLVRVLRQRDDAGWMTALHRVVILCRGEEVAIACFDDLEPGAKPGRIRRAQPVGVEGLRFLARGADASRHPPAVAEKHGHGLIGLAGHDENRHAPGRTAVLQLDDVAVIECLLLSELRTDPGRGVPGQFRQRLGGLLEPAVVGEPAVPHRWIGPEHKFEPGAGRRRGQGRRRRSRRRRSRSRHRRNRARSSRRRCRRGCKRLERRRLASGRRLRPAHETVVHGLLPERVGVSERFAIGVSDGPSCRAAERARPVVLDDVERLARRLTRECCEDLVRRMRVVERRDERLHQRDRAVVRARISPCFERVRVRDVPMREL